MRVRVAAATAAVLALAGCTSSGHKAIDPGPTTSASPSPSGHYTGPPSVLPVPGTTVPMSTAEGPWPVPVALDNGTESAAYVAAAGLPYAEEMLSVHYHAHLDIIVDGKPMTVPAYLGFVATGNKLNGLAPLHTHDTSGVIHIENDVPATFVLGQVFTEWGVRFTTSCLGAYCTGGGKELAVFVDGKRQTGDPTRIVLAKHEEIAVVYGTPDQMANVPSSYVFQNGQ